MAIANESIIETPCVRMTNVCKLPRENVDGERRVSNQKANNYLAITTNDWRQ